MGEIFLKLPEADTMFDEIGPMMQMINRRLGKDKDGVEQISKSLRVAIEDYDPFVNGLKEELTTNHDTMQMVLQYFEDPADAFRMRMPPEFNNAKEVIDECVVVRDRAKEKLKKLMDYYKVTGMKSENFVMAFDTLFVPGDLIVLKPEKTRKDLLLPV